MSVTMPSLRFNTCWTSIVKILPTLYSFFTFLMNEFQHACVKKQRQYIFNYNSSYVLHVVRFESVYYVSWKKKIIISEKHRERKTKRRKERETTNVSANSIRSTLQWARWQHVFSTSHLHPSIVSPKLHSYEWIAWRDFPK